MHTRSLAVVVSTFSLLFIVACDGDVISTLRPPVLVAVPNQLDFGPVPVGIEVHRVLTLVNSGEQTLVVDALAVEGGDGAFALPTSDFEIPSSRSHDVEVSFTPGVEGALSADLVVVSNADGNERKRFNLLGEGTAASVCGSCDEPPSAYCASVDELIVYAPVGECVDEQCRYDAALVPCQSCDAALEQCTPAPGDAGPDAGDVDPDAGEPEVDSGPEPLEPDTVFTDPGEHSFVVPADVTSLEVRGWGGGGGGGNQQGATGGGGGFIAARVQVTPGETLTIGVADGGSAYGDGGGASYLARGTTRLVIAGGGGGGGSDGCSGCKSGGRGGAGGGLDAEAGHDLTSPLAPYCTSATGGSGGGQLQGGSGGSATGSAFACEGDDGGEGTGGSATGVNNSCTGEDGASLWRSGGGQGNGGGGGGGAGYFGGGGAGFIWTYCAGGGGGGSSYAEPGATSVAHVAGQGPVQGNEAASSGAGAGGTQTVSEDSGHGAAGRVELYP